MGVAFYVMDEDDGGDETVTGSCWRSSSAPYIAFSDGYGGEIKFTKINECGPQYLGQRSYKLYICNSDKCNKDCGGTGTPIIKPTPAPTTTTESTSTITSTVPTSSPNDGKNTAIGQVLGFGFTSILMLFITQFLG
uniref:Uncharacterized protein n=1 Tax=Panagrolaimus sp. JU765 TaxID=591449 RepID=A0AC34PZ86_9BILA